MRRLGLSSGQGSYERADLGGWVGGGKHRWRSVMCRQVVRSSAAIRIGADAFFEKPRLAARVLLHGVTQWRRKKIKRSRCPQRGWWIRRQAARPWKPRCFGQSKTWQDSCGAAADGFTASWHTRTTNGGPSHTLNYRPLGADDRSDSSPQLSGHGYASAARRRRTSENAAIFKELDE